MLSSPSQLEKHAPVSTVSLAVIDAAGFPRGKAALPAVGTDGFKYPTMNGPPSFPNNLKKFAGMGRAALADRVSATLTSLNRMSTVDIPALLGKVIR